VQASGSSLTVAQAAAAFRRAAVLAGRSPSAADGVVAALTPVWNELVPAAAGRDLANALLAWTSLQLSSEGMWQAALAAVPAHVKVAGGSDLANIAYALAAMSEANGGSVPGVPRSQVQELLRVVTEEVVSLVSGTQTGAVSAAGRAVSVGNLATVRWAHEVFEEQQQEGASQSP
jgi:hypothetical protein